MQRQTLSNAVKAPKVEKERKPLGAYKVEAPKVSLMDKITGRVNAIKNKLFAKKVK